MSRPAGYELDRVRVLHARAGDVLAHLLAGRIADPAAADAVAAAAAASTGLDVRVLPALARLLASDALRSWRAAAPMPPGAWFDDLRGRHGAELGTALAAKADGVLASDHDELAAALTVAMDDEDAMVAFVEALGPSGLLALVDRLSRAAPTTAAAELAPAVRAAFARAAPALHDDVAAALVAEAARSVTGRPPSVTAGVALGYLYAGPPLPSGFLVASVQALRDVEVRAAAARGQGPSDGAVLWVPRLMPPALGELAAELRLAAGVGPRAGSEVALDPMYAVLRQLAADGAAGRVLFTDGAVAAYVFGSRDVVADGGRAVTAAAAAAAARDGLGPGASAATRRDALLVASGFVNHFGAANAAAVLRHRDDEVSRAVADIVGRHLPSVQRALIPGMGNDGDAVPVMGVVPGALEVFGTYEHALRAQFRRAELGAVLDVAVDTEAGVAALRAHVSAFEIVAADAGAARLADGDVGAEPSAWLGEQMADAARLEGVLVEHIGHRAEVHGGDRDRIVRAWFDAIGEGTELAVGMSGTAAAPVITPAVGPLADRLGRRFAHHEHDAVRATAATAWAWDQRLCYVWAAALVRAGVIDPPLPPPLVAGGTLPPIEELPARLAEVRAHATDDTTASYDLGSLYGALDAAPGLVLDDGALVDAMDAWFERSREQRG